MYLSLLAEFSRKQGLQIVGYCSMTNHGQLVVVLERARREGLYTPTRWREALENGIFDDNLAKKLRDATHTGRP